MKELTVLTYPLVLLILIAGAGGVFFESVYAGEVPYFVTQCIGQDIVNMLVLAPLFLLTALLIRGESKIALFVWSGLLLYTIYSYTIYCFSVKFNALFLVYCGILGLSLMTLLSIVANVDAEVVRSWFDSETPARYPAWYLLGLAGAFYIIWLAEIIPAMVSGTIPASTAGSGTATNPVHVLDIAILLPGCVIAAVLLLKRRPMAYLLVPSLLVFNIIMAVALGGIIITLKLKGYPVEIGMTVLFGLMACASFVIVFLFIRHLSINDSR
ncbi:MAG: hypothetical protein JXA20_02445 [Spirochaetes bacterium]|nr:hypothetical protein [Spirochaetota bacterium]